MENSKSQSNDPSGPGKIDRYEVKQEVGRGGMAVVYLGYDPRFKRDVAIKLLPKEFMHDTLFRERFEQEAQVIAALDHSALVQVYDFGEENGQPYIIMRYMSGGSLADRIHQKKMMKPEEISRLLSFVGSGLDEAHSKGVIHRDIKPGNILFDQRGDPFLSDFGIVSFAGGVAEASGSAMLGTPAYAAPEMLDLGSLTHLVDIYALGATLYEMLTGHTPYEAETPMGMMLAHLRKPTPDVRLERPELPEDVQYVIERAMAKDPAFRYQRAGEMALDFKAAITTGIAESTLSMDEVTPQLLPSAQDNDPSTMGVDNDPGTMAMEDGEPGTMAVVAGDTARVSKKGARLSPVWRWVLIGVAAAVIIIGGLAAAGILPGISGVGARLASSANGGAATATSTSGPTLTPTVFVTSGPTLTAAPTLTPLPAQMKADNILQLTSVRSLTGHSGAVTDMNWSPDGKFLATSANDGVRVWEALTGNNTLTFTQQTGVTGVAWSPDGKSIASTASGQEDVLVWDAATGKVATKLGGHAQGATAPAWSPDSTLLATASLDNKSVLWNVSKGERVWNLSWNESVGQQAFSSDGTRVLTLLIDIVSHKFGSVATWTVQNGKPSQNLLGPAAAIQPLGASWSTDGKRIVGGMDDNSVIVWDAELGVPASTKIQLTMEGHSAGVASAVYSPDGTMIASGSVDGLILIWDALTGERLQTVHAQGTITRLAWSPDNLYLAAATSDGRVTLWAVIP